MAAGAQHAPDAGGAHPGADPRPGAFVGEVAGDGAEGDAAALEGVGDLGERAGAAVGEPLAGPEVAWSIASEG